MSTPTVAQALALYAPARCIAPSCDRRRFVVFSDLVHASVGLCFIHADDLTQWAETIDPRGKRFPTWDEAARSFLGWLRSDEAAMPAVQP